MSNLNVLILGYVVLMASSSISNLKDPLLLEGIGRVGELGPVEQFVCNLYGSPELQTVNSVRVSMFSKAKANTGMELLPPTRDALELHVQRANYQAKIWLMSEMETVDVTLLYGRSRDV